MHDDSSEVTLHDLKEASRALIRVGDGALARYVGNEAGATAIPVSQLQPRWHHYYSHRSATYASHSLSNARMAEKGGADTAVYA